MNEFSINILKAFNKMYAKLFNVQLLTITEHENNPDEASHIIIKLLNSDNPIMIARFGANELSTLVNYIGVKEQNKDIIGYIKGKKLPWWWNLNHIQGNMYNAAGFFPPTIEKIEKFCELMLRDITEVDVLGSWLNHEDLVIYKNVKKIRLLLLDPFWSKTPWTKALKGKKVLVIHPFAELIEKQYQKRELLFDKEILPEFELKTIKAVQSIAGEPTEFKDWFEALESMKFLINATDFDICLIGAGAYGFHLAAHVKRIGKKAVHLGGSLQLLFGIKGKRWEDPNYNSEYNYSALINKYWVYPDDKFKPKNAILVEGGCYW